MFSRMYFINDNFYPLGGLIYFPSYTKIKKLPKKKHINALMVIKNLMSQATTIGTYLLKGNIMNKLLASYNSP